MIQLIDIEKIDEEFSFFRCIQCSKPVKSMGNKVKICQFAVTACYTIFRSDNFNYMLPNLS